MPMNQSMYDDMSEGEKEVAKYLKKLGIFWIYESPVFICDGTERRN